MPESTTLEAEPSAGEGQKVSPFNDMASKLTSLLAETPQAQAANPDAKPHEVKKESVDPAPEPIKTEPAAVAANPLEDTKGMSPTSAEKFSAIKKTRDEFQTKVHEATKALAERESEILKLKQQLAKAPQIDNAEIEQLRKKNDDLSNTIRSLDVERHPEFQALFGSKLNDVIARAKSLVGEDHAAKIESLLRLPESTYKDAQLEDLVSELPEMKRGRLSAVLNEIDQIQAERSRVVSNEKGYWEKIQADKQANSQKAVKSLVESFETHIQKVQDPEKGWPTFQKRDGNNEWNTDVDRRLGDAKKFITSIIDGSITPEALNDAVLRMQSLPPILGNSRALAAENKKLKDQLASYTVANPSIIGDGVPTKGADGKPETAKGFAAVFKENWKGQ